eukprot:Skav230234  [mRNA]  locus=scaffold4204:151904:154728:- [translate_table: standard]
MPHTMRYSSVGFNDGRRVTTRSAADGTSAVGAVGSAHLPRSFGEWRPFGASEHAARGAKAGAPVGSVGSSPGVPRATVEDGAHLFGAKDVDYNPNATGFDAAGPSRGEPVDVKRALPDSDVVQVQDSLISMLRLEFFEGLCFYDLLTSPRFLDSVAEEPFELEGLRLSNSTCVWAVD